jgi:hypothetical protein
VPQVRAQSRTLQANAPVFGALTWALFCGGNESRHRRTYKATGATTTDTGVISSTGSAISFT